MNRRKFLRNTLLAGAAAATAPKVMGFPQIITSSKLPADTAAGTLVFRPYYVQKGKGPHLGTVPGFDNLGEKDWSFPSWAFASDTEWDAFYSDIFAYPDGVKMSDAAGHEKFGVTVRWNVEGFGFIYITADNGGEFYSLPPKGKEKEFNLNYELAKSRLFQNKKREEKFAGSGWKPSKELKPYLDLSEEFYYEAKKADNEEKRGLLAQKSLYYSMWGGEKLELEKAWYDIGNNVHRDKFFLGCDTRGYSHMNPDIFMESFTPLFNYATMTHYQPQMEKTELNFDYGDRDERFRRLKEAGVTVEGRPIFWGDEWCSPDWLKAKSFPQFLSYIEKRAQNLVRHYGDGMYAWEIINEAHDWSNGLKFKPDQMVTIAKHIAEVVKAENPKVHRLINNCCINADYIQLKPWKPGEKRYPLTTPHQFIKMCHEAGVDFDITGQQLYYPYTNRDIADTIRMTERLEKYGRPVQITEIGVTSGPSRETIENGELGLPDRPYSWHRHWDETLQAEWAAEIYTVLYSKPWIEAVNWYDFADNYVFVPNGGVLADKYGTRKHVYNRLMDLKKEWKEKSKKV